MRITDKFQEIEITSFEEAAALVEMVKNYLSDLENDEQHTQFIDKLDEVQEYLESLRNKEMLNELNKVLGVNQDEPQDEEFDDE